MIASGLTRRDRGKPEMTEAIMFYQGPTGSRLSVRVRIVEDFGDGYLKVERLDNGQYTLAKRGGVAW